MKKKKIPILNSSHGNAKNFPGTKDNMFWAERLFPEKLLFAVELQKEMKRSNKITISFNFENV